VRLINYTFDTKYTNEINGRVPKTKAIQQDNSTDSSYSNIQDTRNSFPIGDDSRTLRSSFFAIPAGVGDILVGVTAIPFAIFLWKGHSWAKYAVMVWSVLGIADLVNAVTLGVITNPDFTTSTMSTFPWILVPTVGVPLALALHGVTLYRLRKYVPMQAHRNTLEA